MNVLVLNCGSSTVKFQIIETEQGAIESDSDRRLAIGVIERIGGQALITFQADGHPKERHAEPIRDHRAAIDRILRWIVSAESKINHISSLGDIHAVGHRVVHGGEAFRKSVKIDAGVLEGIEDCIELAPLHNPANLAGIEVARRLLEEYNIFTAAYDGKPSKKWGEMWHFSQVSFAKLAEAPPATEAKIRQIKKGGR